MSSYVVVIQSCRMTSFVVVDVRRHRGTPSYVVVVRIRTSSSFVVVRRMTSFVVVVVRRRRMTSFVVVDVRRRLRRHHYQVKFGRLQTRKCKGKGTPKFQQHNAADTSKSKSTQGLNVKQYADNSRTAALVPFNLKGSC